jgi:hypothetical protein
MLQAFLLCAACLLLSGFHIIWVLFFVGCFVASVVTIYFVKERVQVATALLQCSSYVVN